MAQEEILEKLKIMKGIGNTIKSPLKVIRPRQLVVELLYTNGSQLVSVCLGDLTLRGVIWKCLETFGLVTMWGLRECY